jgi:predicted RNase H-like HicB family nuclease
VGELLRLDTHGVLQRLRGARAHLELVDLCSTPLLGADDLTLPGDGRQSGGHKIFKHPAKPDHIVAPMHTGDLKPAPSEKSSKMPASDEAGTSPQKPERRQMSKPNTVTMPPVYIANVEPEPEGGYSVSFPDMKGCITQGETFAEAIRYAADAAALWLDVNGSYPEPSDPQATSKAIIKAGGIPVAVEAPALKPKIVPVTISLPEPVLRRIDMAAEMQGMTRSAFISAATMQAAGMPEDIATAGRKHRRARAKA